MISIEVGDVRHLAEINQIYNYYIRETSATFDVDQWDEGQRLEWFQQFLPATCKYNLLVAIKEGDVIGFTYNSAFKSRLAYATSSEVSVYKKPDIKQSGVGGLLYQSLFLRMANADIHRIYATITQPNIASVRLHEKFGFKYLTTMNEVGFKQGKFHSTALYEKRC